MPKKTISAIELLEIGPEDPLAAILEQGPDKLVAGPAMEFQMILFAR